ncbi:MAG TPA: hypothetical protein VIX18_01080 [Nitrospirota bacterium]
MPARNSAEYMRNYREKARIAKELAAKAYLGPERRKTRRDIPPADWGDRTEEMWEESVRQDDYTHAIQRMPQTEIDAVLDRVNKGGKG